MTVLADTHSLVWALVEPERLSKAARGALGESDVCVSVVSLWELILKRRKKGALLTEPVPWWKRNVVDAGIPILGIRNAHVVMLDELPDHHRDPFDRMLVAQATCEDMALVTKDPHVKAYGVRVIW